MDNLLAVAAWQGALQRGGWVATGFLALSFVIDLLLFIIVQIRMHMSVGRPADIRIAHMREIRILGGAVGPAADLSRRKCGADVIGTPFAARQAVCQ